MKTFIDNVCRQVIERHFVGNLQDIFGPETVALLSDQELTRIAADSPTTVKKRDRLQTLLSNLLQGLKDLQP